MVAASTVRIGEDDDDEQFDVTRTKHGFDLVNMGAHLEPRGGVRGELRVGDESGEDGRDFGSVL